MRGWAIWHDIVPEVIAFPVAPRRYWSVRPEPGAPGTYRGELVHDEWTDDFELTRTEVGELGLVVAALKDRRWRQGLPIVVEVAA